jgi:hypothetical protein
MNEFPSATRSTQYIHRDTSILEDPYREEVLLDNWQHERKKTRYALFSIGFIVLIASTIAYASADLLLIENLPYLLLFPVLFLGLGLFAHLQPMIAAIGGVLVIVGMTVLNYMASGAISLIAGWLYKVIALSFMIKSIRHAQEAERARKELQLLA